jgi:hypothetical protein
MLKDILLILLTPPKTPPEVDDDTAAAASASLFWEINLSSLGALLVITTESTSKE